MTSYNGIPQPTIIPRPSEVEFPLTGSMSIRSQTKRVMLHCTATPDGMVVDFGKPEDCDGVVVVEIESLIEFNAGDSLNETVEFETVEVVGFGVGEGRALGVIDAKDRAIGEACQLATGERRDGDGLVEKVGCEGGGPLLKLPLPMGEG